MHTSVIPVRFVLLSIGLLCVGALGNICAQSSVSKGPESTYFGNYHPKEPKSLDELPQAIRTKLENHLRTRLGDSFYSKLTLSGGQIVDFADLYRVEPGAKSYKWKVFTYGLTFLYSERSKGVKAYHARILLDGDGNVLQEIDLPQIAKHPDKANLISLANARNIAAKNKFPRTTAPGATPGHG